MSVMILREDDTFYLCIDGEQVSRVYAEKAWDGTKHFVLHLNTFGEEHRRKGYCSMVFDHAALALAQEGWSLMFLDDPHYHRHCGRGWYTADGQAFADAYRTKRGIPLSKFMWGRGWGSVMVHRKDPTKARWKTDQHGIDVRKAA